MIPKPSCLKTLSTGFDILNHALSWIFHFSAFLSCNFNDQLQAYRDTQAALNGRHTHTYLLTYLLTVSV